MVIYKTLAVPEFRIFGMSRDTVVVFEGDQFLGLSQDRLMFLAGLVVWQRVAQLPHVDSANVIKQWMETLLGYQQLGIALVSASSKPETAGLGDGLLSDGICLISAQSRLVFNPKIQGPCLGIPLEQELKMMAFTVVVGADKVPVGLAFLAGRGRQSSGQYRVDRKLLEWRMRYHFHLQGKEVRACELSADWLPATVNPEHFVRRFPTGIFILDAEVLTASGPLYTNGGTDATITTIGVDASRLLQLSPLVGQMIRTEDLSTSMRVCRFLEDLLGPGEAASFVDSMVAQKPSDPALVQFLSGVIQAIDDAGFWKSVRASF